MNTGQRAGFDWFLWIQWVLAGTLGWVAGGGLGALVGSAIVGQLAIGAVTSLFQWLVLRPRVPLAWWWIPLTTSGWVLAWGLTVSFLPPQIGLLAGLVLGGVTGAAQFVAMRRWYRQPGWWILGSAAAWTLGLTGILGVSLVGTVMGAASGLVIELYERYGRLH